MVFFGKNDFSGYLLPIFLTINNQILQVQHFLHINLVPYKFKIIF